MISSSTLHASFLRLAIHINICFLGALNKAFPQRFPLAKFFFIFSSLFVRSEGSIDTFYPAFTTLPSATNSTQNVK
jgi:hypothetical protein